MAQDSGAGTPSALWSGKEMTLLTWKQPSFAMRASCFQTLQGQWGSKLGLWWVDSVGSAGREHAGCAWGLPEEVGCEGSPVRALPPPALLPPARPPECLPFWVTEGTRLLKHP